MMYHLVLKAKGHFNVKQISPLKVDYNTNNTWVLNRNFMVTYGRFYLLYVVEYLVLLDFFNYLFLPDNEVKM